MASTDDALHTKMLHTALKQAILQLFNQKVGKQARKAISRCQVKPMRCGLILICPDDSTANALYDRAEELAVAAYRLGLHTIKINVGTENAFSIPTNMVLKVQSTLDLIMVNQQLIVLPEKELLQEIDEHERGACLIRNKDHKGLYCNSKILEVSACQPNDWIGQDMSRYWDRTELKRFLDALRKHKQLNEFVYNAYLFDETHCEFCTTAKLVLWRGEECRLVKNGGCRPL